MRHGGNLETLRWSWRTPAGAWGWTSLEQFWQDLRYSLRSLRKTPGFAAAAILSLAFGIGANTAIFTLLNAVILRMLPVKDPHQLVQLAYTLPLWETNPNNWNSWTGYPQFERFKNQSKTLDGIFGGTRIGRVSIVFGTASELAQADAYSGSFFSVLGLTPQYGRLFSQEDDRPDASVAVLSDRCWRTRFAADPSIIGGAVTINQVPFTVIGVTPPEFAGISLGNGPDVWIPLRAIDRLKPDKNRWTDAFSSWMLLAGRLRPGVSREQSQAELDTIHRQLLVEYLAASELRNRENMQRFVRETHLLLRPAANGTLSGIREAYALPLKLLMCVAGIVLAGSVCKRCESAVGEDLQSSPGDCNQACAWRGERAHRTTATDRKHRVGIARRCVGVGVRLVGEHRSGPHDLHR